MIDQVQYGGWGSYKYKLEVESAAPSEIAPNPWSSEISRPANLG